MESNQMKYTIRNMKPEEQKYIYKLIKQDFAKGEYPPYFILRRQLNRGVQKGFLLLEGDGEVAYSICAEATENGYILISLLSVYKESRGRGLGTSFLKELKKFYIDKNGLVVEVEKPENAKTDDERTICMKRIEFYQKAGFYLIPGIDYSIWGIPMHLMIFMKNPIDNDISMEIGQIMKETYTRLMGKHFIHKLKFRIIS